MASVPARRILQTGEGRRCESNFETLHGPSGKVIVKKSEHPGTLLNTQVFLKK